MSSQTRKAFEADPELLGFLAGATYSDLQDAYDTPKAQAAYLAFKAGIRSQRKADQGLSSGAVAPVSIPDDEFDETNPIHQAADAYSYACEIMEQHQYERIKAGKEPGTTGSLCDGLAWLYERLEELEDDASSGLVMPKGWDFKRLNSVKGDALGVQISTPRDGGVCRNTSVWTDDENMAHRMLALMLTTSGVHHCGDANKMDWSFQTRVNGWMQECFGPIVSADKTERNHRFLEEALELVQSLGCSREEAYQLVDYVYDRHVGDPAQEVGGVMVTLAALCLAAHLDLAEAAETELTRVLRPEVIRKIREKQKSKPYSSPLPGSCAGE